MVASPVEKRFNTLLCVVVVPRANNLGEFIEIARAVDCHRVHDNIKLRIVFAQDRRKGDIDAGVLIMKFIFVHKDDLIRKRAQEGAPRRTHAKGTIGKLIQLTFVGVGRNSNMNSVENTLRNPTADVVDNNQFHSF
jgi:hypothetical protein